MAYKSGGKSQQPKQGAYREYVINKEARSRYTFRIDMRGHGYYLMGRERLSVQEFGRLFPLIVDNGCTRIDSRQNYY